MMAKAMRARAQPLHPLHHGHIVDPPFVKGIPKSPNIFPALALVRAIPDKDGGHYIHLCLVPQRASP
jgi:hypothetical protein